MSREAKRGRAPGRAGRSLARYGYLLLVVPACAAVGWFAGFWWSFPVGALVAFACFALWSGVLAIAARVRTHFAGRVEVELAELRAGEDDTPREEGTQLTPGQWIHRWNRLSASQRLVMVRTLFANSEIASRCFLENHTSQREELEHIARRASRLAADVDRAMALGEQWSALAIPGAPAGPESLLAQAGRQLLMALAGPPERACCDFHNVHCEPPGDLCCEKCTEANHPDHPKGVTCVLAPTPRSDR